MITGLAHRVARSRGDLARDVCTRSSSTRRAARAARHVEVHEPLVGRRAVQPAEWPQGIALPARDARGLLRAALALERSLGIGIGRDRVEEHLDPLRARVLMELQRAFALFDLARGTRCATLHGRHAAATAEPIGVAIGKSAQASLAEGRPTTATVATPRIVEPVARTTNLFAHEP